MPSVSKIAQHAGVSKSTVSLVLNNKPGVSENMRRQVLSAVDQLRAEEAVSNNKTRSKAKSRQDLLSVVVLHPAILSSSQVFSEFLQGIQAGADTYQVQLRLAINDPNSPPEHITRLYLTDPALRPNGLIIIGARIVEPLIDEAKRQNIPYVLVGRQAPDSSSSAIGRNEEEVTLEATNYLLELGHKAIAFVGGDEAYSYTRRRLDSYKRALQAQQIEPLERWVALGNGREAAEKILSTSPEITAVIFVNDSYAMQGLPVFQTAGRRIPDDLSVISYDDTEDARSFDPPLTSIPYPRFESGLWAIRDLVERTKHPQMQSIQITFKSALIKRASCAPPSQLKSQVANSSALERR